MRCVLRISHIISIAVLISVINLLYYPARSQAAQEINSTTGRARTEKVVFNGINDSAVGETTISAEKTMLKFSFNIETGADGKADGKPGEAYLHFFMNAPALSYQSKENKCITLKIYIDGEWKSDIVVFGGWEVLDYSAYAGKLSGSAHEARIDYDPKNSYAKQGAVIVKSVKLKTFFEEKEIDTIAAQHAPLLFVRDGNPKTDLPVLLYYDYSEDTEKINIGYTVFYTNEDGGTGGRTSILMAQYGRTIDTEWVYNITLNKKTGAIENEIYQVANHKTKKFTGRKSGAHPIIRVSTDNGNFNQAGETSILLGMEPFLFKSNGRPEDSLMEQYPWIYRITNEEMYVEDKIAPPGKDGNSKVGDIRDYILLDVSAKNNTDDRTLEIVAKIKGIDKLYSSDPNVFFPIENNPGKFSYSGVFRATIRLPKGIPTEIIEKIGVAGTKKTDYDIYEIKAFRIDKDFKPAPVFFEFKGDIHLKGDNNQVLLDVNK